MTGGLGEYLEVARALAPHGLRLRGGFHPQAADSVPDLAGGRSARTLLVIGNVGPGLWSEFSASPESRDGEPDPLNRWSARILRAIAADLAGEAWFPFDGPAYLPFIAWAKRAEPVAESPLGILIHPDYGLWHAYRGAIALAGRLALPPRDERPRPCDTCAAKPCLEACPVGAFTAQGYDLPSCVKHIATPAGENCMSRGCRARRACPIGQDYLYEGAQARFHMAAFLEARRPGTEAACK